MRLKSFLAALFLIIPLAACAADASYEEGTDYRTLSPALSVDVPKGKVQVMELFWYGCPHCNDLDPYVQNWVKHKPPYVEFVRVPAVFNRTTPDGQLHPWFIHAKAFYAAQALGVGDKIHEAFFRAIHKEGRTLRTEEELAKFFAENGIKPNDFKAAFNSFAVETKVANAMETTKRSGVTGVPALIVDGKFQVLGKRATSHEDYLRITDYLVGREHGSR